ncbi:ATP-binding protein [Bacillus sp. FJAT-50079]|uniref:hybrid sensor histidine kinase/response regulator n=1 Tax=Bacillus sp. FJAT-50079 TaxID=2833577 RepID=UPI001BC8F777|nr:ATP-binding protein [Bacillus sp. FJAT-50079]MBS4210463.1 histidine kinase [Bacillus sp. FJAT-50079]
MRRKISIILLISIFFVILLSFTKGAFVSWKNQPYVENGVLNLQDRSTEENSVIQLNGEWEFYQDELLDPEIFNTDLYSKEYIQVPATWDSHFTSNQNNIEVGTYRVTIQLPKDERYSIKVHSIRHASKVFMNGIEVGGKGTPSETEQEYAYREGKYVATSDSADKKIEIIIQVANKKYVPNGGIVKPIIFGEADQITRIHHKNLLVDGFIVGGYFLLAVIFFFHYIQSRKEWNELYFAIFCLVQGGYVSTQNEKLIYLFYPEVPNNILHSIQLSFIYLSVLFFLLFIKDMFRQYSNPKLTKFFSVMLGVLAIYFGFPKPSGYSLISIQFMHILVVGSLALVYLYILMILIRSFIGKLEGAEYILVATVCFTCYGLGLGIELLLEVDVGQIPILLFLLMSLSLSIFIGFRRQLAYKKVDDLSKELLVQEQLKDDFLRKTSEELRSPVKGIIHATSTLMEGRVGPLKKGQQEIVFSVNNNGKKLAHLADDLFHAGSDANQLSLKLEPVNLRVVNEMIEELSILIPDKVSIENRIPLNMPYVTADEKSLKQVILNLLQNAIKYTAAGKIIVSAELVRNKVHFSIDDTGIGIENQYLERIFDTFYQVPHVNKNNDEGKGLGLSIAKKFITLMEGDIWARSILGRGTRFIFTLPVYEDDIFDSIPTENEIQPDVRVNMKGTDTPSGKILLVDANEQSLAKITKYLNNDGFTVIACVKSEEALNILKKEHISLAVIELNMPHTSGVELSISIRKEYHLAELPILLLSSSGRLDDIIQSLQSGANDVIQKPILQEEFLSRIHSLLAMTEAVQRSVQNEMSHYYAQIAPHFLYNTLNTIIGLSFKNSKKVPEALEHLSVYFRSKLDFQKQQAIIPLEEEIELVESYLAIEKLRFGNRLNIIYDIDETIQAMIPAMTIQPLVENAVQHGLIKKRVGGTLMLSIQKDNGKVTVIIEDNGCGIPKDKQEQLLHGHSQRIGFKNPFEKVKLLKNSSFQLISKEGEGTRIVIIFEDMQR